MMNTDLHEPNDLPLWIGATIFVLSIYAGLGYWASSMRGDPNVVRGGIESIMLEFVEEPMAPDVEEISEFIREETVQDKEEEKEEPVEEAKPEPEPEPVKSEMVEEIKKPEPKKEVRKPKIEKPKVEPKKDVKKADVAQKASGPEIVAKRGPTYAGPTNNRVFGGEGRLVSSWQNKVQRRIALIAARTQKPRTSNRASAYVTFNFDKSGAITSARMSRSSGDPAIDELALQIVRKSSPIPTPPEGWNGSLTVPVEVR
ncbi:TonB family protein [uncultured Bartonella sp.]|uniref:TonB family protein n=1 Tax=uncultured Bartonella sp. TaxID=104108 RepID=UPI00260356FF|nr:TonB family protein [uncultured Bartonella sp.]